MPERFAPGEDAWEEALSEMERHLEEIRDGLATAALPKPYTVYVPRSRLPERLRTRVQALLASQHDMENSLRERLGVVGAILEGHVTRAPSPIYLDRRN